MCNIVRDSCFHRAFFLHNTKWIVHNMRYNTFCSGLSYHQNESWDYILESLSKIFSLPFLYAFFVWSLDPRGGPTIFGGHWPPGVLFFFVVSSCFYFISFSLLYGVLLPRHSWGFCWGLRSSWELLHTDKIPPKRQILKSFKAVGRQFRRFMRWSLSPSGQIKKHVFTMPFLG